MLIYESKHTYKKSFTVRYEKKLSHGKKTLASGTEMIPVFSQKRWLEVKRVTTRLKRKHPCDSALYGTLRLSLFYGLLRSSSDSNSVLFLLIGTRPLPDVLSAQLLCCCEKLLGRLKLIRGCFDERRLRPYATPFRQFARAQAAHHNRHQVWRNWDFLQSDQALMSDLSAPFLFHALTWSCSKLTEWKS